MAYPERSAAAGGIPYKDACKEFFLPVIHPIILFEYELKNTSLKNLLKDDWSQTEGIVDKNGREILRR
jgi:hypothetical protein